MGNVVTMCKAGGSMTKVEKVLQVMKTNDGKILEFRAPMRVKDLLINYPNCYVGIFMEATQPLPLDYKLKIGKIYYLLPCCSTTFKLKGPGDICSVPKKEPNDGAKRIKVVITKQQLQQLISNQMGVEDLVVGIDKKPCKSSVSLASKCSKVLQSIPEENEAVY